MSKKTTRPLGPSSSRQPRIRNSGPKQPRIDPATLAKALGAERVGRAPSGSRSPPARFALRMEVARRLSSTGGRPGLVGTTRRQKIPLSDEDWKRLEEIANSVGTEGYRPSPAQIASILLHRALDTLDEDASTADGTSG